MAPARSHDLGAATAGAAALLAGVIWFLQWAHVLVTHGPTGYNQAETWLGLTWFDSAKLLTLSYLLLVPGALYLTRSMREIGDVIAARLGAVAVAALAFCAVATPVEFLTDGWGSYRTYVGRFDWAIDIGGVSRALTSSIILTLALGIMAVRGARRHVLPYWMAPVLVVGCIATYFISGPAPPVPALAWLIFGAWLLAQHRGATPQPYGQPPGVQSRSG